MFNQISFHSCRRLNLVPLCYLWQRDQGELLSEMIEGGLTAILIKVAGIGLTTKHLGKTLAEMQPTFQKLVRHMRHCSLWYLADIRVEFTLRLSYLWRGRRIRIIHGGLSLIQV